MKRFFNKKNSVYSSMLLFTMQAYAAEHAKIRKFEAPESTFYEWDRYSEKRKVYRITHYKTGSIVGEVTDCSTDYLFAYPMSESKAKKKIELMEQELAKIKNLSTDKN